MQVTGKAPHSEGDLMHQPRFCMRPSQLQQSFQAEKSHQLYESRIIKLEEGLKLSSHPRADSRVRQCAHVHLRSSTARHNSPLQWTVKVLYHSVCFHFPHASVLY